MRKQLSLFSYHKETAPDPEPMQGMSPEQRREEIMKLPPERREQIARLNEFAARHGLGVDWK